jgi:hypothetical protein
VLHVVLHQEQETQVNKILIVFMQPTLSFIASPFLPSSSCQRELSIALRPGGSMQAQQGHAWMHAEQAKKESCTS